MVGVVHAAVAVEEGLRVGRQDRIGPERPDLADEQLAQGEVVGQGAVRLVQERHAGVPDDRGRRRCSVSRSAASSNGSASGSSPPWSPLVQHTSQPTEPWSIHARRRPGRPELGVVRVRGDDHEPVGPPVMVAVGVRLGQVVMRDALAGPTVRRTLPPRLRSSPPTSEASWLPVVRSTPRQPAAAWASSSAARTSAAWPSGLTFGQTVRDPAVGIDQERRPRRAPVRLAVVLLLDPRAVGLGDRVVLVGEEGERQVELLAERPLAGGALRADAPHVGAALA